MSDVATGSLADLRRLCLPDKLGDDERMLVLRPGISGSLWQVVTPRITVRAPTRKLAIRAACAALRVLAGEDHE